ncbi:MAG: hypothetical protein GF364_01260 [Candidatus Lokiarchaeota archaeon]|nr:hypothetical protein [Candidatus Lokiarchaeota archaeon]
MQKVLFNFKRILQLRGMTLSFGDFEREKIYISKDAYRRMVLYGSRYANKYMNEKEYREVYGILIGYLDENDNTHVRTAIPILAGSGAGVKYESKHYAETAKIDEKIFEKRELKSGKDYKEAGNEFLVGWWHTHPGFGFFFSETDVLTHLGWQQANPFAIGIIYDFTHRSEIDPGIEVLRLADVSKYKMSQYVSLDFALEGDFETIEGIEDTFEQLVPKLEDLSLEIRQLDKQVKRKDFAQLQRNHGLLMVKKRKSEIAEEDKLNDEEKYLYEWNEEWIKKKYRLPKYRAKIEKLIKKGKSRSKDKKRKVYRAKIEKMLSKPKKKIIKIKEKYYAVNQRAKIYEEYLDVDELTFLEHFEKRISDYIDIMNDLIMRAYKIAPD